MLRLPHYSVGRDTNDQNYTTMYLKEDVGVGLMVNQEKLLRVRLDDAYGTGRNELNGGGEVSDKE